MKANRVSLAACAVAVFVLCAPHSIAARPAAAENDAAGLPSVAVSPPAGMLDAGFHELYQLNFQGARAQFLSYQKAQPEDPLGKAAEAASYLFEQFNAKGVFTSAFFLDDAKLLGGVDGEPSENRNDAFLDANRRARDMALQWLQSNPRDAHGLLVLTLADGMEADYVTLIEKKQLASLSLIRQAESEAKNLLAVDPSAQDAYVALGAGNYIVGCLPAYKRAFVWLGGVHGDRARGIQQMQQAADHGHYLQPYAKILLALALEREHQTDRARAIFSGLASEFPSNLIYARELALLNSGVGKP
ncbi:MAG TPA: hypothetical protein VN822_11710 [Candidatus Acidoferrales bacterium]|nr:hypothetical protein [Candidatus Acidoferrales bacterium]